MQPTKPYALGPVCHLMPLRNTFHPLQRTRALSFPVRWTGSALLVFAAFAVRYWLFGMEPTLPYLLFIPAIIVASMFFNRANGIFATALSTLLLVYFFVQPVHSFAIAEPADMLSTGLFVGTGLFIAAMTETLHAAYVEVQQAQEEAEHARHQAECARKRSEAGERDRELLLLEFGHRVKNDLQRFIATMQMQAMGAPTEVAAALTAAIDRIRVIARVHDRLASRDGHATVDIKEFLHDLVTDLRASNSALSPVGLFVDADSFSLSVSRTGSVGLIANELVTNALKHAFPDDREGAVRISFHRDGPDFLLTVADDGIGMPDMPSEQLQRELRPRGGMGRRLIRALAAQLGGRIEVMPTGPTGGTTKTLRFPVEPPGDPIGDNA